MIAPLSCLYTPLKNVQSLKLLSYDPLSCNSCGAYLNPYCQVELNTFSWTCPFCYMKNRLPQQYHGMTSTNIPVELSSDSTTIEYSLSSTPVSYAPAFIFVVDISLPETELNAIKASLLQVFGQILEPANVGLITYGQNVNVYELGFSYCPKMHVFDGKNELTPDYVQKVLGLGKPGTSGKVQANPVNKFVVPFAEADFTITSIVEDLSPDPRPMKSEQRKLRATGVAVQVAIQILEYTFAKSGARVVVFGGGPATLGPGKVVSEDLKEGIRSHTELNQEKAPHVWKATKFYSALAEQAANNGHAVDIFSCSLDQTGILEMKELPKQTGGIIVTAESFNHAQFKKAILKLFEKDEKGWIKMGFNSRTEVKTSKEIGINGAIGHLTSAYNKHAAFAEPDIGIGRTCEWKTAVIDPSTSYTFFFDVVSDHKSAPTSSPAYGLMQFKTRYTHPSGKRVLRVTTIAHNWLPAGATPTDLIAGFDQEACAAITARLAIHKNETEDEDIIKWLDRHLIKFCKRYGTYQRDNPASFQLHPNISLYPQFLFHLRRCCLVNVFGSSPDETVFYRHYLSKEPTGNILTMIQPALDSYSLSNSEPVPVLLSATSLLPDVLLVLDTFFHVVVWTGSTIASWRNAKYHEQEEYFNLKQLLEVPVADAEQLLQARFPTPLFVVCDQNTSQARFLLAVVDPGQTSSLGKTVGEAVNTEDASLQRFMEHLKKFSVQAD
uniref:Protein transport protein SEC23 n=1 Tax=Arcella intermedia TaxID=1963864 RepID=A0A6B2KYB8_9EUKA